MLRKYGSLAMLTLAALMIILPLASPTDAATINRRVGVLEDKVAVLKRRVDALKTANNALSKAISVLRTRASALEKRALKAEARTKVVEDKTAYYRTYRIGSSTAAKVSLPMAEGDPIVDPNGTYVFKYLEPPNTSAPFQVQIWIDLNFDYSWPEPGTLPVDVIVEHGVDPPPNGGGGNLDCQELSIGQIQGTGSAHYTTFCSLDMPPNNKVLIRTSLTSASPNASNIIRVRANFVEMIPPG